MEMHAWVFPTTVFMHLENPLRTHSWDCMLISLIVVKSNEVKIDCLRSVLENAPALNYFSLCFDRPLLCKLNSVRYCCPNLQSDKTRITLEPLEIGERDACALLPPTRLWSGPDLFLWASDWMNEWVRKQASERLDFLKLREISWDCRQGREGSQGVEQRAE